MQTFVYLDPVARPAAEQQVYRPRLEGSLKTPRVALFPNLFTDSAAFLHDLSFELAKLLPGASFPYFDKKFGRYMSIPASPELRAEIVAGADAVVLAYGHCGSCTSGVVHDAVLLAREGVPVTALVTARFREEALFLASALGLPGIPFGILPHPVAGRDTSFHRALAAVIAPQVLEALRAGSGFDAASSPLAQGAAA